MTGILERMRRRRLNSARALKFATFVESPSHDIFDKRSIIPTPAR